MHKAVLHTSQSNPFANDPIMYTTLDLFVGRESELALARDALVDGGGIVFIEGARGTGKSSLGNYLRFEMASRGMCISPMCELPFNGDVKEQYFVAFTLLSSINAIRGVLANSMHTIIKRDGGEYRYLHRDALRIMKWAGSNSSAILQARMQRCAPALSAKHGFYIERLREYAHLAATRMGYAAGIVLQVRVGERCVVSPEEINQLVQPHLSWIFTGPPGSGRKLAGRFENLIWLNLDPLPASILDQILDKKSKKCSPVKAEGPPVLSPQIVKYVYRLSGGDLAYTFHICSELFHSIMAENGLISSLTLEKAKKSLIAICQQDLDKKYLTPLAAAVLRRLALRGVLTTGILTRMLGKKQSSISRALSELIHNGFAAYHSIGRQHAYQACSAAKILYSS